MDVWVDTVSPKEIPSAAGDTNGGGYVVHIGSGQPRINDAPLEGNWKTKSDIIGKHVWIARFTGYRMPLYLAALPASLMSTTVPWLTIMHKIDQPTGLILRFPTAQPYHPPPLKRLAKRFTRVHGLDHGDASEAIGEMMGGELTQCPNLIAPLAKGPAHLGQGGSINASMAVRIKGIPEALLACDCKADVELVVALLFARNRLHGTTVVRTLPLPSVEIVREVSEQHPNMTMQQFIDHCMLDEGLAKRLNWHPYRDEHIKLRGLSSKPN